MANPIRERIVDGSYLTQTGKRYVVSDGYKTGSISNGCFEDFAHG